MKDKILVVIVYKVGNKELAEKAKKIHEVRAGIECEVVAIEDTNSKGWVYGQNKAFREMKFDYFVYSCDDYFPGMDYLKIAYSIAKKYDKGLVVFNDGKWHGCMATAALVKKDWAVTNYEDGNLFFSGYKQNYADPEITDIAIHKGQYIYSPEAVLMEVDYVKETKPHLNKEDRKVYNDREVPWEKRFT